MGLRKEDLPYNHLLEGLPTSGQPEDCTNDNGRAVRESTADIHGPPKSDTSKSSSPGLASVSSELDTPPPAKRKRKRQEPSSSQHVDLTSPSPGKKARISSDTTYAQPSNIRATRFTSSDPSSSQASAKGGKAACPTQVSRVGDSNDAEDPFAEWHSSQSKPRRLYTGQPPTNYHKAAPAKAQNKRPKKEPDEDEQIVNTDVKGFKRANTGALLRTPRKKRGGNEFKVPPVLSPSPRSERASRRSEKGREVAFETDPTRTFKKPPQPPSPEEKKSPPPKFVVPQRLSSQPDTRRSSRSNGSSQDALLTDPPHLQTIKDMHGLADTVQAKLRTQFEAPASSATVSSGPSLEFDNEDGNSSSSLSSTLDIQEIDALEQDWLRSYPPSLPKTQCPICKTFVSQLFMEEFWDLKTINVRQQARFCKAHKVRSAEEEWRKKGYPSIDWQGFAQRLPRYEDVMSGILNGTRRSFHKNAFEDQIKSGVNRTLQQSMMSGSGWESLKMGYYGTKGARILLEYIMSKFASRIRRLAGSDKLVSEGGVSGYVQAVLAPELAVMLVKDDMNVDEEQAREILKESSEVGNLLNEEEDEDIKDAVERESRDEVDPLSI
ncbi:MAG: hypothetical protein Q9201_005338 [Fulgogasparrea decipioides]